MGGPTGKKRERVLTARSSPESSGRPGGYTLLSYGGPFDHSRVFCSRHYFSFSAVAAHSSLLWCFAFICRVPRTVVIWTCLTFSEPELSCLTTISFLFTAFNGWLFALRFGEASYVLVLHVHIILGVYLLLIHVFNINMLVWRYIQMVGAFFFSPL